VATEKKARRGFAAMDPEKRRTIAALGGKACRDENRAYSRDPELAKRAGKIGGTNRHAKREG
jgi:uncharacterized protein